MKSAATAQHSAAAHEAKGGRTRTPFFTPAPARTHELQTRLRLGVPGDRFEVEADRVADSVVDGGAAGVAPTGLAAGVTPRAQRRELEEEAQGKAAEDEEEEQTPATAERGLKLQAKAEDEEPVQAKAVDGGGVSAGAEVARQVHAARGGGNPLPGPVREKMESQFGADFSGVRIHTDAPAVLLSQALKAQAFTRGTDIFFNEDRFDPGSRAGEHLLAHELTHTVQQGAVDADPSHSDIVALAPEEDADESDVRPELVEAIRLARGEVGKVNARQGGGDGKRIGWERLREYFSTAFGGPVVSEAVIDRITMVETTGTDGVKARIDALPDWCGIFAWWALKKAGIPIPDWAPGASVLDALKLRPPGELPHKGDIALDVLPNNHVAMVTGIESARDAEGNPIKLTRVATVNGNTAGDDQHGGEVQERWDAPTRWDQFLDPVGKMTLPAVPLAGVAREPKPTEPGDGEAADAGAGQEPAVLGPPAETTDLEGGTEPPPPESFAESLPEADLTLPPPADTGPAEQVAQIEKVDLTGSSEEVTTKFIDATPSAMAASQADFGSAVDTAMQAEQRDLAEHPPVLAVKTSGAVDVPIAGADSIPIPGAVQIDDGVRGPDPGDIRPVAEAAPQPFRGNAERAEEMDTEDSGSFWDAFKNFLRQFVTGIRTRDDSVDTSAGGRPSVALQGEADTQRMDRQREDGTGAITAQRDAQTEAFRNHPGQSRIQPRKIDEEHVVAVSGAPAVTIEPQADAGVANYAAAPLPQDVRDAADTRIAKTLTPNLADARTQAVDAATTRDSEKAQEIDTAQQAAAQLNADTDTAQRQLVIDNRAQVARLQGEGVSEAYAQANSFSREAATEQSARREEIGAHVKTEEGKAREELDRGEQDAEKKREEGERRAAEKKAELEKAQEEESWWDRVKGAIKRAVKVITDAIDKVFTEIRNAVKTIIEKAKNAAIGLINAARDWVVDQIDKFRDWAKSQVDKYLKDTFPALARRINAGIDAVADTAIEGVNALADKAIAGVTALADGLAAVLDKILSTFQTLLKTAVRVVGAVLQGDFAEALRAAIEGACEIAGVDPKPVFEFFDRAGKAIASILNDPVSFIKNLFGAVGDGIAGFFKNIRKYLIEGVVGWLTGALSEINLTGPFEFSPKGILSIVLQILGLTYDNIKARVIRKIPEAARVFDVVESGYALLKRILTEGPSALWEEIKDQLSNLKDTVMGAIRNWLITSVIKEGIVWLLSLTNPASAIVKAIKLVFDLVMFLVERYQQIKDFVLSVYQAVAEVATGNFTKVTVAVEAALARIVPVLISLLAAVLGLGGIAKQVKQVIETITRPINKAIDWVVDKIVAVARRVIAKLSAGVRSVKQKAREAAGKIGEFLWPKKSFAVEGERHTLYFVTRDGRHEPFIRSTPMALRGFVAAWEAKAGPNISQARRDHLLAAKTSVDKIEGLSNRITALEKARKPVPASMQQEMLALETALASSLHGMLGSKDDLAKAVERYKLEGLTGTYATIPKPAGDYLTGDHQPQAAVLQFLAKRPYFEEGAEGAKLRHRAGGKHADNAYVVNLQGKRHQAGRTYGGKGTATKNAFEAKVIAMEKVEPSAPQRRTKAVAFLKTELTADVAEMRGVYDRKPSDDVWNDLDPFTGGSPEAKSRLVGQIREQVRRGENILAAQPMDELAG